MGLYTAIDGGGDLGTDFTAVTVTGTMSSGAASAWIDLPLDPRVYAAHAICTGAAKWQIGSSDKSIVRDLVLSTYVTNPTASNVGLILEAAVPGGGASLRLFDTSSSSNVWTVWLKYHNLTE